MSFKLTGKRYFSITVKEGVERYLQKRQSEVGTSNVRLADKIECLKYQIMLSKLLLHRIDECKMKNRTRYS